MLVRVVPTPVPTIYRDVHGRAGTGADREVLISLRFLDCLGLTGTRLDSEMVGPEGSIASRKILISLRI